MQHWRRIIITAASIWVLAFGFNFLWEGVHTPLYFDAARWAAIDGVGGIWQILSSAGYRWIWVEATIGDANYILLIYVAIAVINRHFLWLFRWRRNDTLHIIALGLLVAIGIEWQALSQGAWDYGPYMPTILGVGVTPLIQLAATAFLSFWVTRRMIERYYPSLVPTTSDIMDINSDNDENV